MPDTHALMVWAPAWLMATGEGAHEQAEEWKA